MHSTVHVVCFQTTMKNPIKHPSTIVLSCEGLDCCLRTCAGAQGFPHYLKNDMNYFKSPCHCAEHKAVVYRFSLFKQWDISAASRAKPLKDGKHSAFSAFKNKFLQQGKKKNIVHANTEEHSVLRGFDGEVCWPETETEEITCATGVYSDSALHLKLLVSIHLKYVPNVQ